MAEFTWARKFSPDRGQLLSRPSPDPAPTPQAMRALTGVGEGTGVGVGAGAGVGVGLGVGSAGVPFPQLHPSRANTTTADERRSKDRAMRDLLTSRHSISRDEALRRTN